MHLRLLCAVLASLMVWPRAAAADPVTVQLRLVPGDSRHYTEGLHMTVSAAGLGTQSVDITMGVGLSIEDVLEDGSATVRETIDQFDVGGDLADQIDTTPYLGTQITFTARPDGSFSDFQVEGGGQSVPVFGSGASFSPSLPPDGLEVGQSYDVRQSLPLPLMESEPLELPVRTTLDALVIEQDRPSARLIQTVKVPELQMPFGPFGASARPASARKVKPSM